jgi:hypothetical protein
VVRLLGTDPWEARAVCVHACVGARERARVRAWCLLFCVRAVRVVHMLRVRGVCLCVRVRVRVLACFTKNEWNSTSYSVDGLNNQTL